MRLAAQRSRGLLAPGARFLRTSAASAEGKFSLKQMGTGSVRLGSRASDGSKARFDAGPLELILRALFSLASTCIRMRDLNALEGHIAVLGLAP